MLTIDYSSLLQLRQKVTRKIAESESELRINTRKNLYKAIKNARFALILKLKSDWLARVGLEIHLIVATVFFLFWAHPTVWLWSWNQIDFLAVTDKQ